jgi:hypothetical protein
MRDFLGRELQIDDYVIYQKQSYRGYNLAKVIKFTPQKVRIKYGDSKYCELLQAPDQLVKVEGQEVVMYYLRNSEK